MMMTDFFLVDFLLKEGRKNAEKEKAELKAQIPQWHDLSKNPDDLPTESKEYWCKLKSGHYDFRIYYIDSLFYKSHWEELEIIAWCELPKFEE